MRRFWKRDSTLVELERELRARRTDAPSGFVRTLAQRAGHEGDSRVAKALAGHLRANNFERWLLEEALDLLVDGGHTIR